MAILLHVIKYSKDAHLPQLHLCISAISSMAIYYLLCRLLAILDDIKNFQFKKGQ